MHYSSNILFIILLSLNFSGRPVPVQNENFTAPAVATAAKEKEDTDAIPWEEERLLTWADFKCAPVRNTEAVASTNTSLGLAYQLTSGKLTYQITCSFSKTKSWGLLKTDYILAHEQGHFDITEIYARKLHHALQAYQLKTKTFQQDVNAIYKKIVWEKENFQNMYDGQSDHSRNKKVQANWEEIIATLLEETGPYSNYP